MGFTKMRIFLYMELFLLVSAAAAVAAPTEGEETIRNVGELGRRLLFINSQVISQGVKAITKAGSNVDVAKFGSIVAHTKPGPVVKSTAETTAWLKNMRGEFKRGFKIGKKVYKVKKKYCDNCCDANNQHSSCAARLTDKSCVADDQSSCTEDQACKICKATNCVQRQEPDNNYDSYDCN